MKNYILFLEIWNILSLSQQAEVRVKEEQVIGIPIEIFNIFSGTWRKLLQMVHAYEQMCSIVMLARAKKKIS